MHPEFSPDTIRFVLFDLAGTTMRDGAPGDSLVVNALGETLRSAGADIPLEVLTGERGRDHHRAIRDLLIAWRPAHPPTDAEVAALFASLNARLHAGIGRMTEVPGAGATFRFLRGRGIAVGVGSGFPKDLIEAAVDHLGWRKQGLLDYLESTFTVGAGRPDPAMIRHAMARFGIADPQQVLKVGDTVVDVQEGRNAGAWTASVLTGTQGREALAAERPDFILESVAELPGLFDRGNPGAPAP